MLFYGQFISVFLAFEDFPLASFFQPKSGYVHLQQLLDFLALEDFPLASVFQPKAAYVHSQQRRAFLYIAALHTPFRLMLEQLLLHFVSVDSNVLFDDPKNTRK